MQSVTARLYYPSIWIDADTLRLSHTRMCSRSKWDVATYNAVEETGAVSHVLNDEVKPRAGVKSLPPSELTNKVANWISFIFACLQDFLQRCSCNSWPVLLLLSTDWRHWSLVSWTIAGISYSQGACAQRTSTQCSSPLDKHRYESHIFPWIAARHLGRCSNMHPALETPCRCRQYFLLI